MNGSHLLLYFSLWIACMTCSSEYFGSNVSSVNNRGMRDSNCDPDYLSQILMFSFSQRVSNVSRAEAVMLAS